MKINKTIPYFLLFLFINFGCKKGEVNAQIKNVDRPQENVYRKDVQKTANKTLEDFHESFVLNCGSGCAMTYTTAGITGDFPEIEVKFMVEMYVDEQLSETYYEVYLFSYDGSNEIKTVRLKGKNENVLETLLPDAQKSFRDFGYKLIQKNDRKKSSLQENIYYKKTNPETAQYKTIQTSLIKGLEKYSCNEKITRYIPLSGKSQIKLFLIPQDCGDFTYRYYLITIKNNQVVGNLYVEGEWYEPDNEKEKEIRSFSMDNKYNIAIKIQTSDSLKSENYRIMDTGEIVKQ